MTKQRKRERDAEAKKRAISSSINKREYLNGGYYFTRTDVNGNVSISGEFLLPCGNLRVICTDYIPLNLNY